MQLLTSQKKFLVLSICIPKRINGIISEVQLWKKKLFLVLTSGKFLEALGSGIGTGSIFCLSFSLSNRVNSIMKLTHHVHWNPIFKVLNILETMRSQPNSNSTIDFGLHRHIKFSIVMKNQSNDLSPIRSATVYCFLFYCIK